LSALAPEWDALAEHFPTPLLQHDWISAAAAAFCPSGQLTVVTVESAGRLQAAAPLVVTRARRGERLEIAGEAQLFEPGGFLYRDADALARLAAAVVALERPLFLTRLPAAGAEIAALRRTGRSVMAVTAADGTPWLPLEAEGKPFEARLSSRRRAGLRRAERRCGDLGLVVPRLLAPQPQEVEALLKCFIEVEAAGWKGRSRTALAHHPRRWSFFERYAHAAAARGRLRVGFLEVDGRRIAAQLGVEFSRRYWTLKVGYDERWARCSPGLLLMHAVIRDAFARGLEAIEFLGQYEPWIGTWTHRLHPCVTARLYPLSWRGLWGLNRDVSAFLATRVAGIIG
jgi:CelD/BcsL family acetyltransferase involved in cellulose biosynthesis